MTTIEQSLREDNDVLRAFLDEVHAALDAAGCPTGNEHGSYDAVQRIAGLHTTRDYAWRQLDEIRAENVTLRNAQKSCDDCDAPTKAEHEALKLKLKAAKTALGTIRFSGTVSCNENNQRVVSEALSQLSRADGGESQPPSTAKGTLKAFEQIVNVTPFPEGKEMIQTGKAHD